MRGILPPTEPPAPATALLALLLARLLLAHQFLLTQRQEGPPFVQFAGRMGGQHDLERQVQFVR